MRTRDCRSISRPKLPAMPATLAVALVAVWGIVAGFGAAAQSGPSYALPQQTPLAGDPGAGLSAKRMLDSYEIYSLLMPGAVFSNMGSSQNQQWAIAQETVSAEDINPALAPEAALQAPPNHPERFKEAVAEYNLRKDQHLSLARDFQLDRPYMLLGAEEIAEFRSVLAGVNGTSALRSKYAGYPGITYFSQVYFDTHQTAALVYMLDWCGNLCAQAEWVYVEKINGHWVRRSGNTQS